MGTLKPGATYIYERDGDTVYAREFGDTTRHIIGHNYHSPTKEKMQEDLLWNEIRQFADSNPSLKTELEKIKTLYYLLKDDSHTVNHHPV